MSDLAQRSYRTLASRIGLWRYRAKARLERLSRAWRYLIGRLSADDAQRIMLDCRYPAGRHPLLVLTVEDTLEQAHETFADHPELPRLIADGCARVGDKWDLTTTSFTRLAAGPSISLRNTPPPRTLRLLDWTRIASRRPPTAKTLPKEAHHERIHRQDRLLAPRL